MGYSSRLGTLVVGSMGYSSRLGTLVGGSMGYSSRLGDLVLGSMDDSSRGGALVLETLCYHKTLLFGIQLKRLGILYDSKYQQIAC